VADAQHPEGAGGLEVPHRVAIQKVAQGNSRATFGLWREAGAEREEEDMGRSIGSALQC
jgi:hypothetical protein